MKASLVAFLLAGVVACSAQEPAPSGGSRWRQMFLQADRNGDGVITIDETDRPKLFQRLDADGDGRLTPAEATVAVQARRGGEYAPAQTIAAQNAPVPAPAAPQGPYREQLNIPYAQIPGTEANLLSLDVYAPNAVPKGGAPVVMMVHGGGWRTGDKANGALGSEKAAFFTSQGYVYVSINYRLSPAVKHPAHAEDVARAIAWTAQHIGDYGGNPAKITLMGHSAGAHLAALVATDGRYLEKLGKSPSMLNGVILLDTAGYDIPRNLGELSEGPINAALYENAFGKDRDTWVEASPITYVKEGQKLPRFLVFYTDRKSSGPISKEFVSAINKAGGEASDVLATGKSHSTLNRDIGQPGDGPSKLILEFLQGKSSFPNSI